jgi:hypothetical protein
MWKRYLILSEEQRDLLFDKRVMRRERKWHVMRRERKWHVMRRERKWHVMR